MLYLAVGKMIKRIEKDINRVQNHWASSIIERSWSDLYWMWRPLLSYLSGKTTWLERYLIVKIGVEFMRFNMIGVKVITFSSSLQHLYFAHLKHVSQPIKRSGLPSSLLPSPVVKRSNRGRERGKQSFICLHPSFGRQLAYRVVVTPSGE